MPARDIETIYRLAPMQEGMLFHSLSDPELGLYVEQAACVLEGEIDAAGLRRAWERVVAHHPALRASFHWREVERPVQVIHRAVAVPWREEDWRGGGAGGALSPEAEAARFGALLEADRRRGFDLERAPLLRLTLLRTGPRRWRFLWSYHHLLLDGWSLLPVLRQVFDAYGAAAAGAEPELPPARPYVDYIAWLEARDTPAERERDEAFWRRELGGFRSATPLPGARPGAAGRGGRGALRARPATEGRGRTLSRELSAAVEELAGRAGVTSGTVLQGAWALLLARAAGEDDVVFGTVVSGRPAHLAGAGSMVGMFVNTLPVRVRIDEDEPVAPWLRRLQGRLAELRQHEHSPLARVHRWSDVEPGEPLFESLVAFENYPRDPGVWQRVGGLVVRDLASRERTNFPLNLAVVPGEEAYLELSFDPETFEPGAAERLLDWMEALLRGMAAGPDAPLGGLSLLGEEEERRVVLEWSGALAPELPADGGPATIHGLVAEQVRRDPAAVAVAPPEGGREWTYGELWAASGAVAAALGPHPPARLVAVFLERSAEAYATLLGILRTGAAYLPLDPDLPDRRALEILADAGAEVVVTRRVLWPRLAAAPGLRPLFVEDLLAPEALGAAAAPEPAAEADPEVPPEAPAYVIYTSGSTGRPKGVVATHRPVVSLLRSERERLEAGPATRTVQQASLGFDASVVEVFIPLASGGRVIPIDRETLLSPPALARAVRRSGATLFFTTPSLLDALSPEDFPTLEWVGSGADRCPPQVAARWSARHRFWNDYGPTEGTIYCLRHAGPGGPHGPPLGRPIPGARVHVLDRRLRPLPAGVAGEILLGGTALARGYLGRPAVTAEHFVPDPFAGRCGRGGERLYRTGDLGRFLADGNVEFLGRIDHQVKVRGHRVECGEVEAVLGGHPAVAAAAVVAHGHAPHRRLAAFLVPRPGAPRPAPDELRGWLGRRLPEPMVPAGIEWLETLPHGATGKIDRRALESREIGAPAAGGGRPPAPGLEAALARIWSEVLGVEAVAADDDFFRLGGDSILALRAIALAADEGIELTPRRLFENPTAARLAAALEELGEGGAAGEAPEEGGPVPLTPGQRRLLELEPEAPGRWSPVELLVAEDRLDAAVAARAVAALRQRHDALRLVFEGEPGSGAGGWTQRVTAPGAAGPAPFSVVDLSAVPAVVAGRAVASAAAEARRSLDRAREPLRAVLLRGRGTEPDRLLLAVHGLAADDASRGVLLEELEAACRSLAAGGEPALPPRSFPFARWARRLEERARSPETEAELPVWRAQVAPAGDAGSDLPLDGPGGPDLEGRAETVSVPFDAEATAALLGGALRAYQSRPEELVVTALARAAAASTGLGRLTLLLECPGRLGDADLPRTVGCLAAPYPVRLEVGGAGPGDDVKAVKERLRSLPHGGLGFGLLRYLRPDLPGTAELAREPVLSFRYLGSLDRRLAGAGLPAADPAFQASFLAARGPGARRPTAVELTAYALDGRLRLEWRFGPARIRRATVEALAQRHLADLRAVVDHCLDPEAGGFTPSDFPASDLDQAALDSLLDRVGSS